MIRISPDIIDTAISEYKNSNNSIASVTSKYGMSGACLIKHMKKRGIKRRTNSEHKIRANDRLLACEDYKRGMFVKDIATKYGITRRTVTEWVKICGVTPLKFNERLGITNEKKQIARDLYINQELNCLEISKILGVSGRSDFDWIKDVKRTRSEISCILSAKGKKRSYGNKGNVETRFGIIRYDSTFERDRLIQLSNNDNVLNLSRCSHRILYGNHHYNPDLSIEYKCGCKVIEEIKPEFQLSNEVNKTKFEYATRYCKEKKYIFRIITEKELYGK